MKQTELENKSAGYYAFAAARDARMRNIAGASHYSEKQKIEAGRVKMALELVYWAKAIYEPNYREKFISIKVDRAQVKDRENLEYLEAEWMSKGYTKKSTPQGIIYRIPKA
jgi:hypothetical protein